MGLVDSYSPPPAVLEMLNLCLSDLSRSSRLEARRSADGDRPVSFSYLEEIDSTRSGDTSGDNYTLRPYFSLMRV